MRCSGLQESFYQFGSTVEQEGERCVAEVGGCQALVDGA